MNRAHVAIVISVVVVALAAGFAVYRFSTSNRPTSVVRIDIDAGDLQRIKPLLAEGRLPNLATLIGEGASGPLRAVAGAKRSLASLQSVSLATGSTFEKHGITEANVEEIRALYDNGIRATDAAVGELFALLRSQSLYDDAVVVVLSDHGEEFLEHGDFNHGRTVYQELVRVPLLVRLPGQGSGGRVVDVPANLIDVAPTLLGVAGLPAQSQFQGSALIDGASMTKLRSQTDDSPIYFESPNVARGVHGLRIGAYKLIKNGPRRPHELVRLDTDRAERIDLADQLPEIHDSMDARLTQWTRDLEQEGAKNGWMSVTSTEGPQKADIEALQALGYLD